MTTRILIEGSFFSTDPVCFPHPPSWLRHTLKTPWSLATWFPCAHPVAPKYVLGTNCTVGLNSFYAMKGQWDQRRLGNNGLKMVQDYNTWVLNFQGRGDVAYRICPAHLARTQHPLAMPPYHAAASLHLPAVILDTQWANHFLSLYLMFSCAKWGLNLDEKWQRPVWNSWTNSNLEMSWPVVLS